jgi:predicted acyl esterase
MIRIALGAVLAGMMVTSAPAQPRPEAPAAQGMKPFWAKRLTGYLPTRDGEELRYSVILPKGKGPFPVAMRFSGYDDSALGGQSYRSGRAGGGGFDRMLVEAGYAVIGVNRRATGCSTGSHFDWHHPLYGQDGHDAVEWAAAQPWSTGSVGMYGSSWVGMSQLWTASTRPPHLKAIAPAVVIADPRADIYAPGGVPQPAMITSWGSTYVPDRWRTIRADATAENDTRCLQQLEKNLKTLEAGSPGRLVLAHPFKDAYLEDRAPARRAHLINVPVLSITAYQDEATTSRGGYYQWNVDPKLMWMVDTNGAHNAAGSVAYRKQMLRFFDRYLKGRANGWESTPRLQVWEETANNPALVAGGARGVEAAEPNFVVTRPTISPEVKQVSFTLTDGGGLVENGAASTGSKTFNYPVPGPAALAGREGWGPMHPEWREGSLAFTTPPLERDIVPFGPASADLWISTDRESDADLQVTITAVQPDGQEMYVQRGWLRLSNRALDTQKSTAGRPVLLDTPETFAPMIPGRPELARLEVNRFSYPFRKGTRLRIWIDTPSSTGTYRFAPYSVPMRLKVWHDAAHPSKFVINVLENEPVTRPARGCGEVLSQPCRPDPLAIAAR